MIHLSTPKRPARSTDDGRISSLLLTSKKCMHKLKVALQYIPIYYFRWCRSPPPNPSPSLWSPGDGAAPPRPQSTSSLSSVTRCPRPASTRPPFSNPRAWGRGVDGETRSRLTLGRGSLEREIDEDDLPLCKNRGDVGGDLGG
jgi:hypothetical protein